MGVSPEEQKGIADHNFGRELPYTQLGDYELIRLVGHGGMGVVYEAMQQSLGRRVALKVLSDTLQDDKEMRERFENESKIAASMHHSNIVPVYGYGKAAGTIFFSMQFISGAGLDQILDILARNPDLRKSEREIQLPPSAEPSSSDERAVLLALGLAQGKLAQSNPLSNSTHDEANGNALRAVLDREGRAEFRRQETRANEKTTIHNSQAAITAGNRVAVATQKATVVEIQSPVRSSKRGSGLNDIESARNRRGDYVSAELAKCCTRIGEQLANALEYAHSKGVIHRDLKPANIMVDLSGVVWIADFGLAGHETSPKRSDTNRLMGTYRYLAPESFKGVYDKRTDIYGLGLTLFEIIMNRPAFPERDHRLPIDVSDNAALPSLRRLSPTTPFDLAVVIDKCLDPEPANRYQTAKELADDLRRIQNHEPVRAKALPRIKLFFRWVSRNRQTAIFLTVFTSLLIVVGIILSYSMYQVTKEKSRTNEQRERAEAADRERGTALLEMIKGARPEGLAPLLQLMKKAPPTAVHALRHMLQGDIDPTQRLRILAALSTIENIRIDDLVALIPEASDLEAVIIIQALRNSERESLAALSRLNLEAAKVGTEVRIACIELELRNADRAKKLVRYQGDLTKRTQFIDALKTWHLDFRNVPELLDNSDDPALTSALCLVLAQVDPKTIPIGTNSLIDAQLTRLHQTAQDGATHSAAYAALKYRHGGVEPSPVARSGASEDGWMVNSIGRTLLRVPAGYMVPGRFEQSPTSITRVVIFPRDLFVLDSVVMDEEYRLFLKERANAELPAESLAETDSRLRPLGAVDWRSALEFCNWLSRREKLTPCYIESESAPGGYILNAQESGYRLPTIAEQEYFIRCGTITRYFTGDKLSSLKDFARLYDDGGAIARSTLPNPWGLFDTLGTQLQMSWDVPADLKSGAFVFPLGSTGEQMGLSGGLRIEGASVVPDFTSSQVACTDRVPFRLVRAAEPPIGPSMAIHRIRWTISVVDLESLPFPEQLQVLAVELMLSYELNEFSAAATCANRILDHFPEGRIWNSPRSDWIRHWAINAPRMIPHLRSLRPEDTLLRTGLARVSALQGNWITSAIEMSKVLPDCPNTEEWFEGVAIMILADREDLARETVLQFYRRGIQPTDREMAFYAARVCSAVFEVDIDRDTVTAWGRRSSVGNRDPWIAHTEGMAWLRAGRFDEAERCLNDSNQFGWDNVGTALNNFGFALIALKRGNLEAARSFAHKAYDVKPLLKAEDVLLGTLPPTDYLEYLVLEREVRKLMPEVQPALD